MRVIKAAIGPPDKNGVRIIKLTKRKKQEFKKLLKMCDKWLASYKKLDAMDKVRKTKPRAWKKHCARTYKEICQTPAPRERRRNRR